MEWVFVTASRASVVQGVCLQPLQDLRHLIRFSALPPSIYAQGTTEPGSSSGSALSAGRMSFTRRKVMKSLGLLSRLARSPTQTFLRLRIPFMNAEDIHGFNFRQE